MLPEEAEGTPRTETLVDDWIATAVPVLELEPGATLMFARLYLKGRQGAVNDLQMLI